jgi:hypothetical protein
MKFRWVLAVAALSLSGGPVAADPVADILSAADADCAGFENGVFGPGDAVTEVDLDGMPPVDRVVDTSEFSCSTMASMTCGSGGCTLYAVVGDDTWEFQAEGWRMIDWGGRPILLIARDGGWCGGVGAQLCFEAVTWSNGDILTVMPPFE